MHKLWRKIFIVTKIKIEGWRCDTSTPSHMQTVLSSVVFYLIGRLGIHYSIWNCIVGKLKYLIDDSIIAMTIFMREQSLLGEKNKEMKSWKFAYLHGVYLDDTNVESHLESCDFLISWKTEIMEWKRNIS